MGLAVLLGTRPKVSRTVVGGVLSVSAIIALVAGVAGIGAGRAVLPPARERLRPAGGGLAHRLGQGRCGRHHQPSTARRFDPDTVVAGRNAVLTVIFKNLSDEEAKFVVHAGTIDKLDESGQPVKAADGSAVKVPVEYCTDLVRPDTQAALTMQVHRARHVRLRGAGRGRRRPRQGHGDGAVSERARTVSRATAGADGPAGRFVASVRDQWSGDR